MFEFLKRDPQDPSAKVRAEMFKVRTGVFERGSVFSAFLNICVYIWDQGLTLEKEIYLATRLNLNAEFQSVDDWINIIMFNNTLHVVGSPPIIRRIYSPLAYRLESLLGPQGWAINASPPIREDEEDDDYW